MTSLVSFEFTLDYQILFPLMKPGVCCCKPVAKCGSCEKQSFETNSSSGSVHFLGEQQFFSNRIHGASPQVSNMD